MIERYKRRRVIPPDLVLPHSFTDLMINCEGYPETYYYSPRSIDEMFVFWGMRKGGNEFNTKAIRSYVKEVVGKARQANRPLVTFNIMCPPYSKERLGSRKNVGVMRSIEDDPVRHNFLYSYKILIHVHYQWVSFLRLLGIETRNFVVLGDWALRDIRDDSVYLEQEKETKGDLNVFFASLRRWLVKNYFDANFIPIRFRQVEGIRRELPWVMPQTPSGKKQLVLRWLEGGGFDDVGFILERFDTLKRLILHLGSDDRGVLGEVNRQFRARVFSFLQVWRDAYWSRKGELGTDGSLGDTLTDSFWDAAVKHIEYAIYARELLKYTNTSTNDHLLGYFDTKYPSAGWSFFYGGMKPVFLDPRRFFIPMSELGIKFNPF